MFETHLICGVLFNKSCLLIKMMSLLQGDVVVATPGHIRIRGIQ